MTRKIDKRKDLLLVFVKISFIYNIYSYGYFLIKFFRNYLIIFSMFFMFFYYIGNQHIEHKLYKVYVRVKSRDIKRIGDGMEEPFLEYRKEFLETELFGMRHMFNFKQQRGIRDLAENLYRGYHIVTDHSAYYSDLQIFEFSFNFSKTNLKVLTIIIYFLKFCVFLYKVFLFLKNIVFGSFWDFCEDILYLSIEFLYYYIIKIKKDFKIYIISGQFLKDFIKFLKGYPYWIKKTVRFLTIELVDLRTFSIVVNKIIITPIYFFWFLLSSVYRFFLVAIHDHLRVDAELRNIYIVTVIQARLIRKFFYKFVGFFLRLTLALNLFWIIIHLYYTFERLYFDLFKNYIDILVDIFFIIFG